MPRQGARPLRVPVAILELSMARTAQRRRLHRGGNFGRWDPWHGARYPGYHRTWSFWDILWYSGIFWFQDVWRLKHGKGLDSIWFDWYEVVTCCDMLWLCNLKLWRRFALPYLAMQRPLRKGLHAWLHESGEAKTVLIVLKIWKNDNVHDLKFQLLFMIMWPCVLILLQLLRGMVFDFTCSFTKGYSQHKTLDVPYFLLRETCLPLPQLPFANVIRRWNRMYMDVYTCFI